MSNQWIKSLWETRLKKSWCVFQGEPLDRHKIYFLPSRAGIVFFAILIMMVLFGLNYENNLIILLGLILISATVISIFLSYINLNGVSFTLKEPEGHIFADSPVPVPIFFNRIKRYTAVRNIYIHSKEGSPVFISEAKPGYTANVTIRSKKRGLHKLPLFIIFSNYPFGICNACCCFAVDIQVLIAPKPISTEYFLMKNIHNSFNLQNKKDKTDTTVTVSSTHHGRTGQDELSGIKPYRPGEPLSLIDWKQLAKGRGLMMKDFSNTDSLTLYLTQESVHSSSREETISMLTAAALDLSRTETKFGLSFESIYIAPDSGEKHLSEILKNLALLPMTDTYGDHDK